MKRCGIDIGWSKSSLQTADVQGASIANCKTTKVTPVLATARSACPIRVMKLMSLMCAYSVYLI